MKWLALHIGGQRWGVFLVSPKNANLLEDGIRYVGRCVYEKCRIYISRDLDTQARNSVLLHEVFHALLHISGAEAVYEGDADKDEQLVSTLTPHLHSVLVELGFLFPKGPNE